MKILDNFQAHLIILLCQFLFLSSPVTSFTNRLRLPASPPSKRVAGYTFESCFVRWQQQQGTQSPTDARVTTTNWDETSQQVTDTINNYSETPQANNVPLWLEGGFTALTYAGFFTCTAFRMTPQGNLINDNVVASIILPSGIEKLTKVGPYPQQLGQNANRVPGIFGITLKDPDNPLTASDYAYVKNLNSDGTGMKPQIQAYVQAYQAWEMSSRNPKPELPVRVAALRGDGQSVGVEINEITL